MQGLRTRKDDNIQSKHKHGDARSAAPGKATKPPDAVRVSDPLIEVQNVPRNEIITCNGRSVGHTILNQGEAGTAR